MDEAVPVLRRVVVTGRRPSLVDAIASAARAAGAQVGGLPDAPADAVARELAGAEPPDLVVIVTPSSDRVPFLDMSGDAWAGAVERRILEPIEVARAAVDRMRQGGRPGAIVFVGTLDATHAYDGHADASVAMGALGGLVRSLALELARDGLRVAQVLAGPLDDGIAPGSPALVERTLLRSPSKRFVSAEEVAEAVLFVAGPAAGFMTGASLRVDAGWASLNQAPDGMRFP